MAVEVNSLKPFGAAEQKIEASELCGGSVDTTLSAFELCLRAMLSLDSYQIAQSVFKVTVDFFCQIH